MSNKLFIYVVSYLQIMLSKKVIQIATQTRKWAEKHDYAFNTDLKGMCAIASVELFKRLKNENFNPQLKVAIHGIGSHVFVVIDNFIIDITATQFGHSKKVVIKNKKEFTIINWYWRSNKTFKTHKNLIKFQQKTGWSKNQTATL